MCLQQDGKSNIWAVEPKMQVEVSAEGEGMKKVRLPDVNPGLFPRDVHCALTPQTGIIAGGALAAVLAVIGVVTNLPDVDAL
jgi:hypothetical protein